MVLADKRYSRNQLLEKLPEWIKSKIRQEHKAVSTFLALSIARDFFKQMCQPFTISKKILLDEEAVKARERARFRLEEWVNEEDEFDSEF